MAHKKRVESGSNYIPILLLQHSSFYFLISFIFHAIGSHKDYNLNQHIDGKSEVGFLNYLTHARFWLESFQNWQSEFLSIAAIVILSIFLRQQGSPESKPVDASHFETGR